MANQSMDALKRDIQTLIDDAQILFHDASELTGENAEELRRKGSSLVRQALDGLRTLEHTAVTRGRQLVTETDRYVHEKPWYAVGISAGIGVLIGMLIARR